MVQKLETFEWFILGAEIGQSLRRLRVGVRCADGILTLQGGNHDASLILSNELSVVLNTDVVNLTTR